VEKNRDGAAGEIAKLVVPVDSQVAVDRGKEVLRTQWAFRGVFGFGVGGSDDVVYSMCLSKGSRLRLALNKYLSPQRLKLARFHTNQIIST